MIFFVCNIVFFLVLETREERKVQRVHLYIWVGAGHQPAAFGTPVQCFDLCCKLLSLF